jgi:hypothetical protein
MLLMLLALLQFLLAALQALLAPLAPLLALLQFLPAPQVALLAPLAPLLAQPPSALVALLLPPAQGQALGGRCCEQLLQHCMLQLHWRRQPQHCRQPRAWLCLQQPAQQTPPQLLQSLARPRCALLGLQSCS